MADPNRSQAAVCSATPAYRSSESGVGNLTRDWVSGRCSAILPSVEVLGRRAVTSTEWEDPLTEMPCGIRYLCGEVTARRPMPLLTASCVSTRFWPDLGPSSCHVRVLATVTRGHGERRAHEVFEFVRGIGATTPFQLSREVASHSKDVSVILGDSEAVSQLDLLENEVCLVRSTDGASRYAVA